MISISYCITACNEHIELEKLITILIDKLKPEDEIVIQIDSFNVTNKVLEVLIKKQAESSRIKRVNFPLNKDFASFKNNAYRNCTKDYIFQIDADEFPSETLIDNIHDILELNPDTELFLIPRINTVEGLTEAHVRKWGWPITKIESKISEKIIDTDSEEYKLLKKLGYIIEEIKIV